MGKFNLPNDSFMKKFGYPVNDILFFFWFFQRRLIFDHDYCTHFNQQYSVLFNVSSYYQHKVRMKLQFQMI